MYLYAYWKANYILHIFAFKRAFHAIIHSFRKRPQAIFDMGTFSKRLLMLPILKYAYVERHFFLLLIHTLQGILCHILT